MTLLNPMVLTRSDDFLCGVLSDGQSEKEKVAYREKNQFIDKAEQIL